MAKDRVKMVAKKPEIETEVIKTKVSDLHKMLKLDTAKKVRRINFDLPIDLYEKIEKYMDEKSYSQKGFLIYVIKDFFKRNDT